MTELQANIVLEILGRPPEHGKQALNVLIEKLGFEKGVKVLEKTIHEPIRVENSKDLFTTFAEITLKLESINNYLGILFAYMPSHIELIHPEKINLTNIDLNELGNKLISRLHEYDAITKKALLEHEIIVKKLYEVAPHLFGQEPQISSNQAELKNGRDKRERMGKKRKKKTSKK